MILRPFHGLLPTQEHAAKVSAVPYDVVNSTEATALAAGNALSFLHVSRPEIDLETGIDLHSEAVYAKAVENFKILCEKAPLNLDKDKHVYLYRLTMNGRSQTGLVATFSADEYFQNKIKKHEKTRQDKEDDRARHVMGLRSQTGPVFLAYRDDARINQEVKKILEQEEILFDFTSADGVRHELIRIPTICSHMISDLFKAVDAFYIADGHHRAAAGSRAAKECRSGNPNYTGDEEFNYFLAVAFPASELKILPYNRVVKDLNHMTPECFLNAIMQQFNVSIAESATPECSGEFHMYLKNQWYKIVPKFDVKKRGIIEQLDVSILQDNILAPLLGIDDPRTNTRIDFVGGIRGTKELEKRVNSGECAVAFSMFATTLEQLMAVSDANEMMPPKSTWFEPKLRDGLVCHNF